ncbi:MAG: type II toxin-antitoxin system VapC family toxin [Cyanobacteriota bacterium]
MEKIKMILTDTDVIIEFLKGTEKTKKSLEQIGLKNIAISSVTIMELYYGAFDKKELQKIKKNLLSFTIFKIDEKTSDIAIELIEKYSKSHNLEIPDSLIASIAIRNDIELFTYNIKDFKYIKELKLYGKK